MFCLRGWLLYVAGYIFLLIVGVCVVVCMVLVCAAVKTGVEDVSNMLLCVGSGLRVGRMPLDLHTYMFLYGNGKVSYDHLNTTSQRHSPELADKFSV